MVDQQLQLPQPSFTGWRRVEYRLTQSGSGDRERVDQVRLAPHPAAPSFRCGQLWRHPYQPLTLPPQRPLQAARHVPTVHQRPQPAPGDPLRPADKLGRVARLQAVELPTDLIDSNSREGVACARPPRSRSSAVPTVGGDLRADRPQSRQAAKLLSGHARRSREGDGDTTLASQPQGDDPESSQPPPSRVSCPQPDNTCRG